MLISVPKSFWNLAQSIVMILGCSVQNFKTFWQIRIKLWTNAFWVLPQHEFQRDILNSSPPGQNGRLFAENIFRCIFMNEKFYILIKISLKFVPKGPIDNNPALVQIMAWRRIGDKPLSEQILTRFTDAYTRGRWVNCNSHLVSYLTSSWEIWLNKCSTISKVLFHSLQNEDFVFSGHSVQQFRSIYWYSWDCCWTSLNFHGFRPRSDRNLKDTCDHFCHWLRLRMTWDKIWKMSIFLLSQVTQQ